VDTRQKVKKGQDPKMVPHMKDAIGEMDLEAIDAYVKINGTTSLAELKENGWVQPGDKLLEVTLPSGKKVFVLRRSGFTAQCRSHTSAQLFALSADETRAIAYFSGTDGEGNPWCGAYARGREYNGTLPIQTPWVVKGDQTNAGLHELEAALNKIEEAQKNPDKFDKQASDLADEVTKERITEIRAEITSRREDSQSLFDYYKENPLMLLLHATIGGTGFGIGMKLVDPLIFT